MSQYQGRHRAQKQQNNVGRGIVASAALAAGIGLVGNGTAEAAAPAIAGQTAASSAAQAAVKSFAFAAPVTGTHISSGFGMRWGRMHKGVDFAGRKGTPIRAVAAGRVTVASNLAGYGKVVYIDHGDGTQTRYAHLNCFSTKVGERVKAGEKIGELGNTGHSTGPHLHFEVRIKGRAINPLPWLDARGVRP
ncbi:M23 family metallopeptidase [Dermatophilus congolensis]|uniref:Murein hydrolase activator NlpD n=1 Tax=Dermatophilus congolensis TaxID=1863 RepID=A0AA46BL83_9MICO|nr:M23 family metallopeptidase [Dermatophilus congolensis]MBO3141944.1 M23 family metallopeptidase [Dermatophilus congolensis]MBO3150938.1 M23 family metallopeptidase [Dermatophilus congolensis]MBO3162058.1 M23 family metallopeptidase [Dermatophilus congolensis]MBO3162218.1 M23 family metallopeptidase [Dermatophilus congolensis]MBO3175776.1 M23 family metallopeptidase [Dermatophilus congolensis]